MEFQQQPLMCGDLVNELLAGLGHFGDKVPKFGVESLCCFTMPVFPIVAFGAARGSFLAAFSSVKWSTSNRSRSASAAVATSVPSSHSILLPFNCQSTLLRRTARFRRNVNQNECSSSNKQFKRNFSWLPFQRYQQHQQQQSQDSSTRFMPNNRFFNYFRSLKWSPIPISLGIGFLVLQQYRKVLRQTYEEATGEPVEISFRKDWEITCYRMFPWKTVSKAWGWVNSVHLPVWVRTPVISLYVKAFNCDLAEAEIEDLTHYANLGEFFRRNLKPGIRPIDPHSLIVSPCDGKVLHFGKIDCGRIEQVKGVCYSLPVFLGPITWTPDYIRNLRLTNNNVGEDSIIRLPRRTHTTTAETAHNYCTKLLKQNAETSLFYCVFYLAPGDYHKFHSPATWAVNFRRHIGGDLLSVNPSIANWIAGLFSLNERANYIGEWEHGYFSMTAVGATNVGSIRVYKDKTLATNSSYVKRDVHAERRFRHNIKYEKGDSFGEFNLGSTIVLIFEAPHDYTFNLVHDQLVKVGQSILQVERPSLAQTEADQAEAAGEYSLGN